MAEDTRRWLVRKEMAGRGRTTAAPFDVKQVSIVGPDTEPTWLMTVEEHERQMEIHKAACDILARTAIEIEEELAPAVARRDDPGELSNG